MRDALEAAFVKGGARLHEDTWHVHDEDMPAIAAALAARSEPDIEQERETAYSHGYGDGLPARSEAGTMRDALHEGLVALYGECHHDRGEASDCDVLVAALAARSEPDCALRIQLADGTWTRGCDAARSEPGAEGLDVVPGHVWRYQSESGHALGCCVHGALAETDPKP